jgi:hypothetical protein
MVVERAGADATQWPGNVAGNRPSVLTDEPSVQAGDERAGVSAIDHNVSLTNAAAGKETAADAISHITRYAIEAPITQYICYIARDRLNILFQQLDAEALENPHIGNTLSMLSFGHPEAAAENPRARLATVSRLAIVRDYLERTTPIGDLAAIVTVRGRLNHDWYLASSSFKVSAWDGSQPNVYLEGNVADFRLRLSCAKEDFSGLGREGAKVIPTSTNRFLFEERATLPMQGLIRLADIDRRNKLLMGAPLYLVLNPLNVDLGEYNDVVL